MPLSIGAAIYIAVKPLIKIFLCASMGFILAKKNILSVETCQNLSVIIVNFFMPCLVFYNVLASLDSSDGKTIGVMILTATLYQGIGLFFSLFVKATTPNPKYWMGGLLCAGIFTNWGDLPIAYVTTLSSGTLFTAQESRKGIAYSILFLVVFIFSMFNLGCFRLVEGDSKRKVRDIEAGIYDSEADPSPGFHALVASIKAWYMERSAKQHEIENVGVITTPQPDIRPSSDSSDTDPEPILSNLKSTGLALGKTESNVSRGTATRMRPIASIAQKTVPGLGTLNDHFDSDNGGSLMPEKSENMNDVINAYAQSGNLRVVASRTADTQRSSSSTEMGILQHVASRLSVGTTTRTLKDTNRQRKKRFNDFLRKYRLTMTWEFIKNFSRPPSASLFISIILTMIPTTRRLFYIASDSTVHNIPNAPDGAPILGFAMDFTSFVGNACVPLGLSMLGATMARLSIGKLPKGFWKSVVLMAVLKLVVLPIIAIAWTEKMKDLGWIAKDNYIALFVMIISSGVPCATSQVYLTAIYQPPDVDRKEMDCLAAYLIFQYALLVFSMTILLTYTLKNVLDF